MFKPQLDRMAPLPARFMDMIGLNSRGGLNEIQEATQSVKDGHDR